MHDFVIFLKYWFTIFILGIIFFPFVSLVFKKFNDKGWIFSKVIGIAISSWLVWILSYIRILKYTQFSTHLILFICAVVNIVILVFRLKKHKKKDYGFISIKWDLVKNIAINELLFICFLGVFVYLKGITPAITNTTEQFMDYGFMNSIMNSEYMPPEDIWFSGNSINYYYFGLYISGFICKVANLKVNEGYNIIIALLASFTFVMPYSIGYNLLSKKVKTKFKVLNIAIPFVLATFIGIAVCFGR